MDLGHRSRPLAPNPSIGCTSEESGQEFSSKGEGQGGSADPGELTPGLRQDDQTGGDHGKLSVIPLVEQGSPVRHRVLRHRSSRGNGCDSTER